MPDHSGRRRRQSRLPSNLPLTRIAVLLVALAAVVRLLTLPEPPRAPVVGAVDIPLTAVPSWTGPAPVTLPGRLADGTTYTPRIFLTGQDSVGVAATPDSAYQRVLLRGAGDRLTELRRVPAAEVPQFDGFAVDGDTLVWAESVSRSGADLRSTLWRSNWRTGVKAGLITTNTGEASFLNREFDIVVAGGRVSWVAVGAGEQTEIRSVAVNGGQVAIQRLPGQFALTTAGWAVSLSGGQGSSVDLVNLATKQQVKVGTSAAEIATCNPRWCRMAVLGANNELARIDLERVDGTERRRIAGNEATPTITDVAMLDRFIPLKTDRGADGPVSDPGLSIYDVTTGDTELVAPGVANIQAYGGMLWWSTGVDDDLLWHALDLRTAS